MPSTERSNPIPLLLSPQARSKIAGDKRWREYAILLKELHSNWTPHRGQVEIGNMIFHKGKRRIFGENGRKWGKTEFACYMIWRLGNMMPGASGYYYGSSLKGAREIIWENNRLVNFGPRRYIAKVNNQDMRITFTNDTKVKVEGAAEAELSRGFNPHFVILDEFKDITPSFWSAMTPNFATHDCIVLIIGTPPEQLEDEPGKPCLFVRVADMFKNHPNYGYVNQPSWVNEHLPPGFLEQERRDCIELAMYDTWLREYEAKRVRIGGKRVVGTFDRDRHVRSRAWMTERLYKERHDLQWCTVLDPGHAGAFGGLLMAINPYSKHVYFVSNLYEKDLDQIFCANIWPQMRKKEQIWIPDWKDEVSLRIYDEAELWWANEFQANFPAEAGFLPTEKGRNAHSAGVGFLRMIFAWDMGYVCEGDCDWFIWELENHRLLDNGRPDNNCHLIDCSRYGLHAWDYEITREDRPTIEKPPLLRKQLYSIEDDLAAQYDEEDLTLADHGLFAEIGDSIWN